MKVTIEILGRGIKEIEISDKKSLKDIAKILGVKTVEYIPSVDGRITTWDYIVNTDAKIKLIPVVSGG